LTKSTPVVDAPPTRLGPPPEDEELAVPGYRAPSTADSEPSEPRVFIEPKRRYNPRRPTLGFGIVLGFALSYLTCLVLIPLGALVLRSTRLGWEGFFEVVSGERAAAAFSVTFGSSLIAALVNTVFGLIAAWVLVRYEFPGRRLLDAAVDLPFALPTAVAGIALTAVFAESGVLGGLLASIGIQVAFTRLGITMALIFIGIPFVIRTLQPVIEDLDPAVEEAALALGASRLTTFNRIIFPEIAPALISGFTLAFARALGEYGSVVFISGNMPLNTEIVPLLIVTKLEQYDYDGATAIATLMLAVSFGLLLTINVVSYVGRRRLGLTRVEG
jgi:sulfate/thiosulfate transport system permease protein